MVTLILLSLMTLLVLRFAGGKSEVRSRPYITLERQQTQKAQSDFRAEPSPVTGKQIRHYRWILLMIGWGMVMIGATYQPLWMLAYLGMLVFLAGYLGYREE